MAKKKKLSRKFKFSPLPIILWIAVAIVLILFFAPIFKQYFSRATVLTPSSQSNQLPQAVHTPALTPTPPPPLDFSQAPIQPRNTFDLSTWKQFDDPQVGLRFKYPPEWGNPQITFRNGEVSGKFYLVSFYPKSKFRVSGVSLNFQDLPRDGNPDIFKGFSTTDGSFGWVNPQVYCQDKYFAFCQVVANRIDIIQEQELYFPYQRLEYINRPDKDISGLRIGGEFLASADNAIALWFQDPRGEYTLAHIKDFDNAIIQRKIGRNSLYTFDEYEKVFETIENY